MKNKSITTVSITVVMLFAAVTAQSQMLAKVHGKCVGMDGKPMVGVM